MENEKLVVENTHVVFIKPLQFYWKPKEDITSFELALCIPFLIRFTSIMPGEVDKSQKHFRHFEIIDPNSISVTITDNQESNKKDTLEQKGFDIPNNSCCFLPQDPFKRYCTFPDPTKRYCTFPDLVVVQNTFKDSPDPINILNNSTSTAEVDLDNPLTKPTGL
jgi:hypothetical protein